MSSEFEQVSDLIKRNLTVGVNTNAKNTNSLADLKKLTDLVNQHEDIAKKKVDTADKQADIELKRLYATRFLWILSVQLIAMNGVFVAVGLKWLELPETTIDIFMTGTLA